MKKLCLILFILVTCSISSFATIIINKDANPNDPIYLDINADAFISGINNISSISVYYKNNRYVTEAEQTSNEVGNDIYLENIIDIFKYNNNYLSMKQDYVNKYLYGKSTRQIELLEAGTINERMDFSKLLQISQMPTADNKGYNYYSRTLNGISEKYETSMLAENLDIAVIDNIAKSMSRYKGDNFWFRFSGPDLFRESTSNTELSTRDTYKGFSLDVVDIMSRINSNSGSASEVINISKLNSNDHFFIQCKVNFQKAKEKGLRQSTEVYVLFVATDGSTHLEKEVIIYDGLEAPTVYSNPSLFVTEEIPNASVYLEPLKIVGDRSTYAQYNTPDVRTESNVYINDKDWMNKFVEAKAFPSYADVPSAPSSGETNIYLGLNTKMRLAQIAGVNDFYFQNGNICGFSEESVNGIKIIQDIQIYDNQGNLIEERLGAVFDNSTRDCAIELSAGQYPYKRVRVKTKYNLDSVNTEILSFYSDIYILRSNYVLTPVMENYFAKYFVTNTADKLYYGTKTEYKINLKVGKNDSNLIEFDNINPVPGMTDLNFMSLKVIDNTPLNYRMTYANYNEYNNTGSVNNTQNGIFIVAAPQRASDTELNEASFTSFLTATDDLAIVKNKDVTLSIPPEFITYTKDAVTNKADIPIAEFIEERNNNSRLFEVQNLKIRVKENEFLSNDVGFDTNDFVQVDTGVKLNIKSNSTTDTVEYKFPEQYPMTYFINNMYKLKYKTSGETIADKINISLSPAGSPENIMETWEVEPIESAVGDYKGRLCYAKESVMVENGSNYKNGTFITRDRGYNVAANYSVLNAANIVDLPDHVIFSSQDADRFSYAKTASYPLSLASRNYYELSFGERMTPSSVTTLYKDSGIDTKFFNYTGNDRFDYVRNLNTTTGEYEAIPYFINTVNNRFLTIDDNDSNGGTSNPEFFDHLDSRNMNYGLYNDSITELGVGSNSNYTDIVNIPMFFKGDVPRYIVSKKVATDIDGSTSEADLTTQDIQYNIVKNKIYLYNVFFSTKLNTSSNSPIEDYRMENVAAHGRVYRNSTFWIVTNSERNSYFKVDYFNNKDLANYRNLISSLDLSNQDIFNKVDTYFTDTSLMKINTILPYDNSAESYKIDGKYLWEIYDSMTTADKQAKKSTQYYEKGKEIRVDNSDIEITGTNDFSTYLSNKNKLFFAIDLIKEIIETFQQKIVERTSQTDFNEATHVMLTNGLIKPKGPYTAAEIIFYIQFKDPAPGVPEPTRELRKTAPLDYQLKMKYSNIESMTNVNGIYSIISNSEPEQPLKKSGVNNTVFKDLIVDDMAGEFSNSNVFQNKVWISNGGGDPIQVDSMDSIFIMYPSASYVRYSSGNKFVISLPDSLGKTLERSVAENFANLKLSIVKRQYQGNGNPMVFEGINSSADFNSYLDNVKSDFNMNYYYKNSSAMTLESIMPIHAFPKTEMNIQTPNQIALNSKFDIKLSVDFRKGNPYDTSISKFMSLQNGIERDEGVELKAMETLQFTKGGLNSVLNPAFKYTSNYGGIVPITYLNDIGISIKRNGMADLQLLSLSNIRSSADLAGIIKSGIEASNRTKVDSVDVIYKEIGGVRYVTEVKIKGIIMTDKIFGNKLIVNVQGYSKLNDTAKLDKDFDLKIENSRESNLYSETIRKY